MSDRMTAVDISPRAVAAALAEITTPSFRTKDLASRSSMLLAHSLWGGEAGLAYYTSVGNYLSLHCEELGIRRISPDGAANATWKKIPARK
jgi:hypothetical protein